MENVINRSSSSLLESGVLGAVLLIMFFFIFFFLFKFYLPQQARVLMEKARLDAEVQANRDRYNQQQVDQLLALLKDDRQRFDAQTTTVRQDHGRAYETQREFFRQEAETNRLHSERTVDRFCNSIMSLEERFVRSINNLEATIERNSMILLASAEFQGVARARILDRVETMTGETDLKSRYPDKTTPKESDSQTRRKEA